MGHILGISCVRYVLMLVICLGYCPIVIVNKLCTRPTLSAMETECHTLNGNKIENVHSSCTESTQTFCRNLSWVYWCHIILQRYQFPSCNSIISATSVYICTIKICIILSNDNSWRTSSFRGLDIIIIHYDDWLPILI